MSALLVLTNVPQRAAAERLAELLVEKKLAACVNILAPCRSVYRWEGAVQHDEERCKEGEKLHVAVSAATQAR